MATASLNTRRPGYLLAGAIVLHVGLISAQVTTGAGVPFLEVVTFGSFAEIQRVATSVVDGIEDTWSGYIDLRRVRAENEALRQALVNQAERLRELLELRARSGVQTTAAEVIASAADPRFRTITIDKGVSHGIRRDMAIISPVGVVGRVLLPSSAASKVQLLIDRDAAAGAVIERSRAQGIVVGVGSDVLQMQYVPGTADVAVDDRVLTSGIDSIYPKGFVIGTVESVDRGPGTFHSIRVRPAVDFSRLEEVLVVLTPSPAREGAAAEGQE
ncbi:MAG: rod shape-determining protein MreC [Acidobacteria bacterium]|nr:rod shape-determining protein MreC [Acidobacteriota bacterium]